MEQCGFRDNVQVREKVSFPGAIIVLMAIVGVASAPGGAWANVVQWTGNGDCCSLQASTNRDDMAISDSNDNLFVEGLCANPEALSVSSKVNPQSYTVRISTFLLGAVHHL